LNERAPFCDVGVLAVTELCLRSGNEWTRVNCIQQFLLVQGDTRNVDRLEPLLNLSLRSLTLIDEQRGLEDQVLLILGQAIKVFRVAAVHNGELVGHKPANAGYTLLPIKDLKLSIGYLVKVNETKGVCLQNRGDYCLL